MHDSYKVMHIQKHGIATQEHEKTLEVWREKGGDF